MSTAPAILPSLREDLRLYEGNIDVTGQRAWLIYDPVRHRFFQIDALSADLLSIWRAIDVRSFQTLAETAQAAPIPQSAILDLVQFLLANNLTNEAPNGDPLAFAKQEAGARNSILKRLLHNYLFFKVPLVSPAGWLHATLGIFAPLFSRTFFVLVALLGLAGLYLVSRQWDVFQRTFVDFLTLESAAAMGGCLLLLKVLHELGHAYTATRYGVRVNTMGVAFMLGMPLLYTDVTDAWRLRSRGQRLAIAGAGIAVELIVAVLATLAWVFLPDGTARSAAFIVATTSWLLSVAINLNPFMRFDGYYLLSDAWGIPNLQQRSFAVARWWVRELLFGLGKAPPESFDTRTRNLLVLYAIGTWIYRLILFIGIALIVYHAFFKVLGVFLFAVEIWWFVARPIWSELREWWKMRGEISASGRTALTGLLFAFAAGAFFVPWNQTLLLPAVMTHEKELRIYAPHPAQIATVALSEGARVRKGQRLLTLRSQKLEAAIEQTRLEIAAYSARLARIAGDLRDRSQRTVLQRELRARQSKLAGLQEEIASLVITAPFSGTLRDVQAELQAGDWLSQSTSLAMLVDETKTIARAFVHEDQASRLSVGNAVQFIPENPTAPKSEGRIVAIAQTALSDLNSDLYVASIYGGALASDRATHGRIVPRAGWFVVTIEMQPERFQSVTRGTVHAEAEAQSLAAAVWQRIVQVLIREAGI